MFRLQIKISLCVISANIFYKRTKIGNILGIFAIFHPSAKQIAQDSAEILVTGVTEQAAGVCKHTDKIAKDTQVGKTNELVFHTDFVVIKPPSRAVLDFAGNFIALICANQGVQPSIVGRIQTVKNGFGEVALFFQGIHNTVESITALGDGNAVIAGVSAQGSKLPGVGISFATEVELHHPAKTGVLSAAVQEECGLIAFCFSLGQLAAGQRFLEDAFQLCR